MNAISIEAKQHLRDRRATLVRLASGETAKAGELEAQSPREPEPSIVPRQVSELHRRDVALIDAALVRIEKGTFGECEHCGSAIGRQRLRAIPEAPLCITCTAQ